MFTNGILSPSSFYSEMQLITDLPKFTVHLTRITIILADY